MNNCEDDDNLSAFGSDFWDGVTDTEPGEIAVPEDDDSIEEGFSAYTSNLGRSQAPTRRSSAIKPMLKCHKCGRSLKTMDGYKKHLQMHLTEDKGASYGWGVRHMQIAAMAMATFATFSLRTNLSVGIVAMVRYKNRTTSELAETYEWGEDIQGYILSSFFWGYFILQIPAGIITTKFGGHRFLCFAILGSSILTLVTPQCTYIGGWFLVCINRMLQGVCQGFVFPSLFTLLGVWAPPKERSRLASFALGAQLIGTVTTTPISGYLCSVYGWPSVFYVFGSLGLALGIAMVLLGSDTPGSHRMISDAEKKYIQSTLDSAKVQIKVPWKNVLTSGAYWSAHLALAFQALCYFMLMTKIPTYLATVLRFNIQDSGVLMAIPYLVAYIMNFLYSSACDFVIRRRLLSMTATRKVFNSIAQFGSSAGVILMAHSKDPLLSVVILTALMGCQAASFVGVQPNFVDLAPNFSGTIFSLANFSSACMGLAGPLLVGFIVTEAGSSSQWAIVFYLCATFLILSNINFLFFGTAETQWWNWPDKYSSEDEYKEAKKRAEVPQTINKEKMTLIAPE